MTRTPIDYSKTIIYRIVCKDVNVTECYIGQTTNFIKRKSQHKENCNGEKYKNYNYYVYQFIRNNMGWDNWDMIEIEKYESVDSNDASKRERYWIEFYKASLNKYIPSRTDKEYRKDNKEKKRERDKEYREKNKQQIVEKKKEYYKENKQQIAEKNKEYHEKNKQQIAEKRKEKVICECGSIISKCELQIHKKNKKHLSLIA
jgi:hypothetical protein